jgi:hypothetical protein
LERISSLRYKYNTESGRRVAYLIRQIKEGKALTLELGREHGNNVNEPIIVHNNTYH